MKKALMIVLAVLISVAFVTTVFAQAPKAAPEKAAAPAPEKAKAEKPAKAPKAKAMKEMGEFVSADAAAKTIVVKGEKGDMTFDVSGMKKMAEFKAGDKVTVMYKEKDGKMMASSVKKAAAKKAEKKAEKKEKAEKKAEEKPAAPAPAPAPAKK